MVKKLLGYGGAAALAFLVPATFRATDLEASTMRVAPNEACADLTCDLVNPFVKCCDAAEKKWYTNTYCSSGACKDGCDGGES